MSAICLLGAVAASFLPETAGAELPETIEEACAFGAEQDYFKWMRPGKINQQTKEEAEGTSKAVAAAEDKTQPAIV